MVFSMFTTVPSGSRAILLEWDQATAVLGEGLHFPIMPIKDKVVLMSTQIHRASLTELDCGTSDVQEVLVDVTVNYRLRPSALLTIWNDMRNDYEARVVKPNIEGALKATTAQFIAEELLTKRPIVRSGFKAEITERLRPYGIDVVDVNLENYQFRQDFLDATNAKVIAKQDAQRALNELEKIRYEAQQQIIQAEAAANATIATAQASATSRIIRAQAEAEAIRLIQEQIAQNPEYLQYVYIKEWDGVLPYYYGGSEPLLLISPDATNSTGGE